MFRLTRRGRTGGRRSGRGCVFRQRGRRRRSRGRRSGGGTGRCTPSPSRRRRAAPTSSCRPSRASGHVEARRMSGATRRNVQRSRWIADASKKCKSRRACGSCAGPPIAARRGRQTRRCARLTSSSCRNSAEMESFGLVKSLALLMLTRSPFDAFDNDLRNQSRGSSGRVPMCRA